MRRGLLLLTAACVVGAAYGQTAAEYNAAGVEAYNRKDWQQAVELFGRAYELNTNNGVVRRNLCNACQAYADQLAKQALFAEATDQLLVAISADTENPSPLIQLGSYYLRLDMADDAIFRLEEAVELDPENMDAHELLGDAYYKQNSLLAALAQWELVREFAPNRRGLQEKMEKAYREQAVEGNYGRTGSRHFEIKFAPGTSGGDVSAVLQHLEMAYRDIGRRFGGVYPPTPIQVIVYTLDDFAQTTLLDEHVGAVYDGKIRVPLKDKGGQTIDPKELERRLYHEYTHVVVRFLADSNVPWWINEGLAETFSTELSSDDAELLQFARDNGKLFSLADLDKIELRTWSPDALRLAYVQSHATVRYMYDRFGLLSLSSLMTAMAEGMDPKEAVRLSYKRTYDMLEKEVAAQVFVPTEPHARNRGN
jgi:hypothetical protein